MAKQISFIRVYDQEIDPDLKRIDGFIDDDAINSAFFYKHGRLGRNPILFSINIRMHILKAIKKIPSFNMLVKEVRQRKAYRRFCNIRSKQKVPCAATLSNFRYSLTFRDRITLMQIFIKHAQSIGFFNNCLNLHVIDSTDIVSPCSSKPIATKEIGGRKVEYYNDPTATKGKRASKKGKSKYFIGHRKHTLSIRLESNKTVALLSLVAPAHQHDSHFLLSLLHLAKLIGLDIDYLVGDLAYIDTRRKKIAKERYRVIVHTDKKENTKLPEFASDTGNPECILGVSMRWLGYEKETYLHSYGCGLDNPRVCSFYGSCDIKTISKKDYPVAFGEIPTHTHLSREMIKARKLIEPGFWRDKRLYGMEEITLMGKKNVHFLSVITDICGLLEVMAKLYEECEIGCRKAA